MTDRLTAGDRFRVVNENGIAGWSDVAPFGSEGTVLKDCLSDEGIDGYDVKIDRHDNIIYAYPREIEKLTTTPRFNVGDEVVVVDYSGVPGNDKFPITFPRTNIGDRFTVVHVRPAGHWVYDRNAITYYLSNDLIFREEALVPAFDVKVGDRVRVGRSGTGLLSDVQGRIGTVQRISVEGYGPDAENWDRPHVEVQVALDNDRHRLDLRWFFPEEVTVLDENARRRDAVYAVQQASRQVSNAKVRLERAQVALDKAISNLT